MEEIEEKKKIRKIKEEEIFEKENIETFDYNKVVSAPPSPKSKVGYPIVMITKTTIIYKVGENSNSSISKKLGKEFIVDDKIYL